LNEQKNVANKAYLQLVLWATLLAIPATLLMILYILLFTGGIQLLWTAVPEALGIDRRLYTVIITTSGGLLVGLILVYLKGYSHQSLQAEMAEGQVEYRNLPGLMLAAIVTLSIGASMGPEAPLAHLGGGLGTWLAERLKYTAEQSRLLALSGIAAVFGGFTGNAIGGAFLSSEFTGLLYLPLYTTLLASTAAALIGMLIFNELIGAAFVGLYDFEPLTLQVTHFVYAFLVGVVGVVLALVFKGIHTGVGRLVKPLSARPILKPTLGGLGFGITGALLPLTMFSGEHELESVMEQGAEFGVLLLLVLALVKLFNLSLCLHTGFPGGFIFPILFAAGTVGTAVHQLIPAIPLGLSVACLMAGAGGAILRMPIATIFLIGVITQPDLIPVIIVATFTGFFIAILTPTQNARQAYQEAEEKAAMAQT
jgi:H+/Cl- antiporter ClcA